MSVSTQENREICVALAISEEARTIVEVGVKSGRLSRMLAQVSTLTRLYLVDSWKGVTEDKTPPWFLPYDQKAMDRCARRVKDWAEMQPKVTVLHMRSVKAARTFMDEQIDFVYIDADHTLEGVTTDIESWLPKVRVGGVLSGDDYVLATVKAAVDRLLPTRQLAANGRLWWTRK